MYSLDSYLRMIADRTRIGAYEEAIRRCVTPGSVVVDIGSGPGIMAMLACRHGARHVYALEPEPIAEVARDVIRANGLADRITVLEARSTEVDLPEPADVIVSDLRGILPLLGDHIPSIVDARARHLKHGGVLIPSRDRIYAAVVEAPAIHPRQLLDDATELTGLDFASTSTMLTSTWTKATIRPDQLLSDPGLLVELDYATLSRPDVEATVELPVTRNTRAHGICIWFDTDLADGIGFSNAPGSPCVVYESGFFPWPAPLDVNGDCIVRLTIQARLVNGSYVWSWLSSVVDGTGKVVARFDQSNLGSAPVLASRLRRHSENHLPEPWATQDLDMAILHLIDGRRSNGAIASAVQDKAGSFRAALDRVTELVDLLAARKATSGSS